MDGGGGVALRWVLVDEWSCSACQGRGGAVVGDRMVVKR